MVNWSIHRVESRIHPWHLEESIASSQGMIFEWYVESLENELATSKRRDLVSKIGATPGHVFLVHWHSHWGHLTLIDCGPKVITLMLALCNMTLVEHRQFSQLIVDLFDILRTGTTSWLNAMYVMPATSPKPRQKGKPSCCRCTVKLLLLYAVILSLRELLEISDAYIHR